MINPAFDSPLVDVLTELESWCVYVLQGILEELRQIDQLADLQYLQGKILRPALDYAKERQIITQQEASVLLKVAHLGVAKAGDLAETMPGLSQGQRTYQIRKLVERKMLLPRKEGSRQ